MVSTHNRLKQTKEKLVSPLKIHRKLASKKNDDLEMGDSDERLLTLEATDSGLTSTVGELVEQLRLINLVLGSVSATRQGRSQRRRRLKKKWVMEVDGDDDVSVFDDSNFDMAATAAATFSVASMATCGGERVKSKPFGMKFNSPSYLKGFSGLKATTSVSCESDTSFAGKESTAALRATFAPRAQKQTQGVENHFQPEASTFKVAVLGAAGGIGQPLALLIKMSPLVSALHLYDIANVKGVAADLSHCNTPSQVLDFTGQAELANSLKGVDVVVIPAGVPRKPGMTRDDLFNINASIVKNLMEAVADNCPDAFIHIISNPVNSTVPIAAEVLKQKGVYDPKKLFGVSTLDVVRANTFVAQKKNLKLIDVDVPVVGGHAGITILPLLSKTRPSINFTDEEIEELTIRIQNAGTEVVEAKAGAGSATLSMAYAAARFVESSLRALDGDTDVYECSYVQSELTDLPFFASRIKLGKNGVEAVISTDLQGLTEYELKALEALKPELKGSIEKGVAFAQKKASPAAV
ncbi:hypothetical protein GIB67_028538 [Kingdonia uniflora]|uniref:malate dehydrogenase n=1 Tax=Kingdonia uniflora TaxID=39325 RepID=A0A7J7KW02_9MAGN|nr:hypothetical protein GIB67_028538 [Kingdonia uniflora]